MPKPQYGYDHQKRRRALLPRAYGQPCPMCGQVMLKDQALDLDHSLPHALGGQRGDRIVHAACNRRAGQRLAMRNRAKQVARGVTSRRW